MQTKFYRATLKGEPTRTGVVSVHEYGVTFMPDGDFRSVRIMSVESVNLGERVQVGKSGDWETLKAK